jgi:hypothetical protein
VFVTSADAIAGLPVRPSWARKEPSLAGQVIEVFAFWHSASRVPGRKRSSLCLRLGLTYTSFAFGPVEVKSGKPIANNEPGEFPLGAEDLRQEVTVIRRWDAIVCIKRCHHHGGVGANSGVEDRQEKVPYSQLRDFGVIVITAANGRAVSDEVLEAGRDSVRVRKIFPLKSADPSCRVEAGEIRILPESFRHSSPAWVTGKVAHRSKTQSIPAARLSLAPR